MVWRTEETKEHWLCARQCSARQLPNGAIGKWFEQIKYISIIPVSKLSYIKAKFKNKIQIKRTENCKKEKRKEKVKAI